MKRINDIFKSEFDKIDYPSLKEENLIQKNIREKYQKNQKIKKVVLGISTFLLVCLFGIGIGYAEEISDIIRGFTFKTTKHENGNESTNAETKVRKEVNYDADLPEVDSINDGHEYSIEELEEILDIKILKSEYFKNDILKQEATVKEQGKIAGAAFVLKNLTKTAKSKNDIVDNYNMYIDFVTKYAPNSMHSGWGTGQGMKTEEYYLENLETTAYILSRKEDFERPLQMYFAHLIYDNMHYTFYFECTNKTIKDEQIIIKSILDSLHY